MMPCRKTQAGPTKFMAADLASVFALPPESMRMPIGLVKDVFSDEEEQQRVEGGREGSRSADSRRCAGRHLGDEKDYRDSERRAQSPLVALQRYRLGMGVPCGHGPPPE